jgi:hypothetical protein
MRNDMQKSLSVVALLLTLLCSASANSATPAELDAIAEMGRLNGIALQCRYVEKMQKIKMSLVLHLPRQRELGDWFERSTNQSFMDFMNRDARCPPLEMYEQQLEAAIKDIEKIFQ